MFIQIVLSLKESNNAQIMVVADHYISSMLSSTFFTDSIVANQMEKVKDATNNLRNKMNAPLYGTQSEDIAAARDVLDRALTKLKNIVQDIANDSAVADANRVTIVHSAGMTEKAQVHPQARKFTVKQGDISGTVVLTAQGGANANEWQMTTDIEKCTNRIPLPTTVPAKTIVSNLQKKTDYAFFHRAVISGTETNWEGPIIITVV